MFHKDQIALWNYHQDIDVAATYTSRILEMQFLQASILAEHCRYCASRHR